MLEWIPLLVTTIAFIGALAYFFTTAELESIRANWNERRCEPLVMTMAHLIPKDDSTDRNAFASENFKFCMGKLIDSSLSIFFKPFISIFSSQVDLSAQMSKVTNTLRGAAASLMKPFSKIFEQLFNKFRFMLSAFLQMMIHIKSALQRTEAILVAKVFAGMSMMRAILNTINYVIRVVFIILGILVILVIFLWFVLFPYVPIIISVIAVLVTTAAGAAAGGMRSTFCVAPNTEVAMEDGSWKQAKDIQPGERLMSLGSLNIVEGVLRAKGGENATCVRVKGVIVSSDHLLYHNEKWMYAKDHPEATPLTPAEVPEELICLNTSTHTWTVRGEKGSLLLRDWEEIPSTPDMDANWESMVYEMLNRAAHAQPYVAEAPGRGLFGDQTVVELKGIGMVPLYNVKIGDEIFDKGGYTKVLAVYYDSSVGVPREGPNDSAWIWYDGKKVWRHPLTHSSSYSYFKGIQLITESGTFFTFPSLGTPYLVRDFTEVGIERLERTYPFTLGCLNKENETADKVNFGESN